ncbi:MAG: FAD-binding oxidoreductase [Caldilineaceae bacterium]|nr:FAD-binding oxidoreductase [Caldilineaceae bacterium]
MDLRSGYPFWLVKNGLVYTYPALESDQDCDVVVIGGGITGALAAYTLVQEDVDVIVVDKRDIGWGSTSASTAMLQYEIDKELHELKDLIGPQEAVRAYQLGVQSLNDIQAIVAQLGVDCGFQLTESVYAARYKSHLSDLQSEYTARKDAGFDVRYVKEAELSECYGVKALAAIVSAAGAQVDPLRLTHALHQKNMQLGARVYDRTEVCKVQPHNDGVTLQTDRSHQIKARRVVFATGYESQSYLKQKVVDLNSTYALISEPVAQADLLGGQYLLWETARPYFYARTSSDGRFIMGGGDLPFQNPDKRDHLIGKKSQQLLALFAKFYPERQTPEVAYAWAGAFGETKDGLAYIGQTDEMPNAYFALGYGGNGITYSMIAARMIADLYVGRRNDDAYLFRFDR